MSIFKVPKIMGKTMIDIISHYWWVMMRIIKECIGSLGENRVFKRRKEA